MTQTGQFEDQNATDFKPAQTDDNLRYLQENSQKKREEEENVREVVSEGECERDSDLCWRMRGR